MNEWLLANGGVPIRYNLFKLYSMNRETCEIQEELNQFPEVQYWLEQLEEREEKGIQLEKIHGSHDYRYENIMRKLSQLGYQSGTEDMDCRCEVYRQALFRWVTEERGAGLSFKKLYSYYDHELIIAVFLALAGYRDKAIRQVAEKRINILFEFTCQKRYDIYVDGSKLPGVPQQWAAWVIDPDLYADGQIHFPTIHDFVLLAAVVPWILDLQIAPHSFALDEEIPGDQRASAEIIQFVNLDKLKSKIDSIVSWLFDPGYGEISNRYGYFWIPGGSYSTKAVCWKLDLPDLKAVKAHPGKGQSLIQRVLHLSALPGAGGYPWMISARDHLDSFRIDDEKALFPSNYLIEKRDGYWIFGAHMGMGENRKLKYARMIESSYWMELLDHAGSRFSSRLV